eukprot:321536_1
MTVTAVPAILRPVIAAAATGTTGTLPTTVLTVIVAITVTVLAITTVTPLLPLRAAVGARLPKFLDAIDQVVLGGGELLPLLILQPT